MKHIHKLKVRFKESKPMKPRTIEDESAPRSSHFSPAEMPAHFVCFWDGSARALRFRRNAHGTYDQWIWNEGWDWDDNVGQETAEQYFSDPATMVATF